MNILPEKHRKRRRLILGDVQLLCCLFVCLQDIQAEIDAHNDIYKSVEGNKSKMVKALGSSDEAVFLQHRLDDMNQRWSDLKAKSANIRWVNHIRTKIIFLFTFSS